MKEQASEKPFLCPECGSRSASIEELVEPDDNAPEPWRHVLCRITCARCHSVIPAHLAERWDGMTVAAARAEWVGTYRRKNRRHS